MDKNQPKQPIIGREPTEKKENPEELKAFLRYFTKIKNVSENRRERLLDLMQRQIAKTWKPAKKAKMVRRLTTANQLFEEAEHAVDQIQLRLSQITDAPKQANNVAPFVPATPSSV